MEAEICLMRAEAEALRHRLQGTIVRYDSEIRINYGYTHRSSTHTFLPVSHG